LAGGGGEDQRSRYYCRHPREGGDP
jgi:hypothetical protein